MHLRAVFLLAVCLVAMNFRASAQQLFPKHYLNVGAGAGLPRADIRQFFADRPAMTANYSYRFHRYLQADAGYDVVFGSGQVNDFLRTQFGDFRIRDFQHFVPFGGRGIIPMANGRVLFSAGGGGVWLRYQEQLRQPNPNFRLACPACTSRNGFGGYGLVSIKFTNRWQRLWFGATTKVIRANTNGDAFAGVPGIRTRDQWINTFLEFGFGF